MQWLMNSVMDMMKGKKTYLQTIGAGGVMVAMQMGWIDADTGNTVLAALGVGIVLSMRAAIK